MSVHAARTSHAARSATRRRALLALPAAALLVTASCSNGADDTQTPETVTATVSPPVEVSTPTPEQPAGDRRDEATDFDRTNCDTELSGQDVTGDVTIRDGQTCVLSDLTVTGDIDVLGGGRLEATTIRVTGDIEAEGHAFVLVSGGEVAGSIELDRGGEATIEIVRVGGDLESEENTGPQRYEGNTIGGDLECAANAQAPTGGGNEVGGEREGQCATF
ncbi:hypothetical protein SAMN06265174_102557 [Dietzia kunjamensis subsp. schimae]|uniref:Polymer-forming protein n=1 Tax=Dietzia kunjamensis subsp. schimae TaxID=498198 RepID=A0ABY1N097_9ACTN|nr:hypothetical protein [Dietzia kunjamensis]SMO60272.1 hypothetical protein SAMN06265174_102557 [Dietzia kunjamensis subsp. schimae]